MPSLHVDAVRAKGSVPTYTPVYPSAKAWKSLRKMLLRNTMLYRKSM